MMASSDRLDSKISEVFSNLLDSVNLDSVSEVSFPWLYGKDDFGW